MIKEINNIDEINFFLDLFNLDYKKNPFREYLVFDNIGILIYSKIYDRLEIDYIFVVEKYRNNKIASKMLEFLFNKYNYSCSLEVNCSNLGAINLYEKFNFKKITIRKNYYGDSDAYLMVREC